MKEHLFSVLRAPHISEKSARLQEHNQYVFEVAQAATKADVKTTPATVTPPYGTHDELGKIVHRLHVWQVAQMLRHLDGMDHLIEADAPVHQREIVVRVLVEEGGELGEGLVVLLLFDEHLAPVVPPGGTARVQEG